VTTPSGLSATRAIRRHCQELISAFDVRTPSLDTPARNLSGGNIQKLIMARELSAARRCCWSPSPPEASTSRHALHHERLLFSATMNGGPDISEDLDEIMTICDRVLVMYEGTIIGSADPGQHA